MDFFHGPFAASSSSQNQTQNMNFCQVRKVGKSVRRSRKSVQIKACSHWWSVKKGRLIKEIYILFFNWSAFLHWFCTISFCQTSNLVLLCFSSGGPHRNSVKNRRDQDRTVSTTFIGVWGVLWSVTSMIIAFYITDGASYVQLFGLEDLLE